jgi:putative ABC transport system permease protein
VPTLLPDVQYSLRRLVRTPGFTLTAVLTLALGIGANTAIFSTVNALLLRPYSFPRLDRLMLLREADPNQPGDDRAAPADYLDFRTQSRAFSDIAAFRFGDFNLNNEADSGAVEGYSVTPNLFQIIGAQPLLGRSLSADDGQEGRNLVAVISHNIWRQRFGSDSAVVGRTVRLNGRSTTIIGVMPAGFHYPLGAEIWLPLTFTAAERADRLSRNLYLLGQLRDGFSRTQAESELQALSKQFQQQYPATSLHRSATVLPLREEQYAYTAPMFLMLQAAAGFVLLLACANLLNLMLAQTVSRRREIAVRSALGASRIRLVGLFASENLLLALFAVSAALSVSFASVTAIRNGMPYGMTKWIAGWADIHLDARALIFSIGLAVVLAIALGLGSTFHASRMNVGAVLKDSSGTSTGSRGQYRVLSSLVITQVILAVVLLTGAASTIRSFFVLSKLYKGFDPENADLGSEVTQAEL